MVQPTLFALWRSFTQCTFIEDDGDVVFFKNQRGEALREYAEPNVTGGAEADEKEADALQLAGL